MIVTLFLTDTIRFSSFLIESAAPYETFFFFFVKRTEISKGLITESVMQ